MLMAVYYIDCDDDFSGIYKNSANCNFIDGSLCVLNLNKVVNFFFNESLSSKGNRKAE